MDTAMSTGIRSAHREEISPLSPPFPVKLVEHYHCDNTSPLEVLATRLLCPDVLALLLAPRDHIRPCFPSNPLV